MTQPISILHISDLHLTDELTHTGRKLWDRAFLANTHDFNRLEALAYKVKHLRMDGANIDLLVATGDISTDGRRASLELGRRFFESPEIRIGSPERLLSYGLGFSSEECLVLPGNHDRYSGFLPLQQPSSELEEVFGIVPSYPYSVATTGQGENPVSALFFVFDSTNSNEYFPQGIGYRAARGRINDAECDWLSTEAVRIREGGVVRYLDGVERSIDYGTAVKIVLLHHHPVLPKGKFKGNEFTVLVNHHRFSQAIGVAEIDLVLFGHQHKHYVERDVHPASYHTVTYICCPSASEFTEIANGWHYYRVYSDRCELWRFTWNGTSFVEEEPQTFEFTKGESRGAGSSAGV